MASSKGQVDGASNQASKQSGFTFSSVLVSNIPPWMNEDKLTIHFQKTSNGGGDVHNITIMPDPSVAIVTFIDPKCAYNVLRTSQTTDRGETLKVELHTEVFGEVTAVLPENVLQNLNRPLLEKIKKETGVKVKRDDHLSLCGTWNQVKAARRIIQLYLSPDIHDHKDKPPVNSTTEMGAAKPYGPGKYQENHDDVDRPASTNAEPHPRVGSEGLGQDMEWEDASGGSPSTAKPSASASVPSHHTGGSNAFLKGESRTPMYDPYQQGKSQFPAMSRTDEEDNSKYRGDSRSSSRNKVKGSSGPHSFDPQDMRQHETSHLPSGATNNRQYDEEQSGAKQAYRHSKGTHSSASFTPTQPDKEAAVRRHVSTDKGKHGATEHAAGNSGDDNDDTQPKKGSQGDDDCAVDPGVLHILQQTRGPELQKSLSQNHVRFIPNKTNTSVQFIPISRSLPSDLERARNTFIDLYQEVHNSLKFETMDISGHDIPSYDIRKALERVKEVYSLLQITELGNNTFSFYGVESDVREARKALCEVLEIPTHRGQRRTKANSAARNAKPTTWPATSVSPLLQGDKQFECTINGVKVTIMKGDITKQDVDIIVNASDVRLSHGGGVAAAIVSAGGYSIQADCNEYVYSQGPLQVTECMWTTAGHLPCKHVIHAVGPRYYDSGTLQKLRQTCCNIFAKAEELKATCIALPAISTGLYGVPPNICAQAMFEAIMELTQHGATSLCDICIVDIKMATVRNIAAYFKRYSGSSGGSYSSSSSSRKGAPSSNTTSSTGSSGGYSHKTATHTSNSKGSYADAAQSRGGASGFGQGNQSPSSRKDHTQSLTKGTAASSPAKGADGKDDTCPICLEDFTDPKTLPQCKHKFCGDCLDQALKVSSQCPICKAVVGTLTGTQPRHGTMKNSVATYIKLPGYPNCGAIVIDYHFQGGTQGPEHPNPGRRYYATSRRAYLPDNHEGREVLGLLRRAFNQRLVFTVGTSASTGLSDNIVWNDIHHKTNIHGGPTNYGYPDPGYLRRVKEELAAKGIK